MTLPKSIFQQKVLTLVAALAVFFFSAIARLAVTWPGLLDDDAARFERPDTAGYISEAGELATSGKITGTGRVPGFPVFASLFIDGDSGELRWRKLAVALALTGAATSVLVFLAGSLKSLKVGAAAGLIHAWNLTAAANSPMLLSDTLFGFFAAVQFLLFMHLRIKKRHWCFVPMVGAAAMGVLIRPINLLWIFPALALLILDFDGKLTWRRKLVYGAAGVLLFMLITFSWMFRNASLGAGFTPDTNTGAMHHQNGAMLMAQVNGTDFESEKARLIAEEESEFSDRERYPDEASREAWRLRRYREMVMAHPHIWLRQSATWRIFIPDAPTFLELLGVTKSDRGTMGVMAKYGFFAGVRHYFGGNWLALVLTSVVMIPVLLLYACALARIVCDICRIRERWYELVAFLAFAEYYLLLPGAITAPRYQIPALPVLCVLSALFMMTERQGAPAEGEGQK